MNSFLPSCQCAALLLAAVLFAQIAVAQGPASINSSSYTLNLEVFATHTGGLSNPSGSNNNPNGLGSDFGAIDVAAPRDGTGRVFVSSQEGQIFGYDRDGNSLGTLLDLRLSSNTTGFTNGEGAVAFRGLMFFDFHPDFAIQDSDGFGKIYTGYQVKGSFDNNGAGADYRIQDFHNQPGDNQYAIAEWSINGTNANLIDPLSYREVFRFQTEGSNPHGLGEIAFNPNSSPGDADYGLLYAAIGDGNASGNDAPATGYLQNLNNPFGSIIRINPLQNGSDAYSIPPSNPFVGDTDVAEEIYAYGFRDPQTFSFGLDDSQQDVLLTFDIGAAEREELSLARSGLNYGWERYEGTRLNNPGQPLVAGSNHSEPVLEYDHRAGFAIIGGLRVTDPDHPTFKDQVLFSDLPTGKLFFADYQDLLDAETNGTQIGQFFEINNFTEDGVVVTENAGGGGVTLEDVFGAGTSGARGDARFGTDEAGNVYIVSKQTRNIYKTGLVTAMADGSDAVDEPIDPPASGQLINISLSSLRTPTQVIGPGAVGSANDSWNEIGAVNTNGFNITAGSVFDLEDSSGETTQVDFSWSSEFQQHNPDSFGIDSSGVVPLNNSWFVDDNDFNTDPTFTISGLGTNQLVDLTLMGTFHFPDTFSGSFNRGAQFTVNGQSLSTTGVDGVSLSLIEGSNYVTFRGLQANGLGELLITLSPSELGGSNGRFFDVNGLQLVIFANVLAGDFDGDGDVDADDIDAFIGQTGLAATGDLVQLDLDQDGQVTFVDRDFHIANLVQTTNGIDGTFKGDLNLDGTVNVLGDAFTLVSNLGSSGGWAQGDFNGDGTVNVLGDAFLLISNLGNSNTNSLANQAASIPEPSTIFFVGLIGLLLLVSRRSTCAF